MRINVVSSPWCIQYRGRDKLFALVKSPCVMDNWLKIDMSTVINYVLWLASNTHGTINCVAHIVNDHLRVPYYGMISGYGKILFFKHFYSKPEGSNQNKFSGHMKFV